MIQRHRSSLGPFERSLAHAFSNGSHDGVEILHKSPLERGKTMEALYIRNGLRDWPRLHQFHLGLINEGPIFCKIRSEGIQCLKIRTNVFPS